LPAAAILLFSGEGTVIEESLMLLHSSVEGNVVVLDPTAEGVEEEDGVLVALLEELLSGVFQEENVTIVEGVSQLEGVNGISVSFKDFTVNFSWGQSVLIHAVVELNLSNESHA